jgi:membrane protease YdiL (CAAX protease family)
LGIRRTRFWRAVGWMLAIYVAISAVEGLWSLLAGVPSARGGEGGSNGTTAMLITLAGMAVVAPIVEEVAFRGYLFAAFTRRHGPWTAALLNGICFGAFHIAVYPVKFLPALAAFGFGVCLLFWFTGSLLPGIALHALTNSIVVAAMFDWTWQALPAIAGSVVLTQLLLLPLARERAPQAPITQPEERAP